MEYFRNVQDIAKDDAPDKVTVWEKLWRIGNIIVKLVTFGISISSVVESSEARSLLSVSESNYEEFIDFIQYEYAKPPLYNLSTAEDCYLYKTEYLCYYSNISIAECSCPTVTSPGNCSETEMFNGCITSETKFTGFQDASIVDLQNKEDFCICGSYLSGYGFGEKGLLNNQTICEPDEEQCGEITNNVSSLMCMPKNKSCPINQMIISTSNPDPSILEESLQLNFKYAIYFTRESTIPPIDRIHVLPTSENTVASASVETIVLDEILYSSNGVDVSVDLNIEFYSTTLVAPQEDYESNEIIYQTFLEFDEELFIKKGEYSNFDNGFINGSKWYYYGGYVPWEPTLLNILFSEDYYVTNYDTIIGLEQAMMAFIIIESIVELVCTLLKMRIERNALRIEKEEGINEFINKFEGLEKSQEFYEIADESIGLICSIICMLLGGINYEKIIDSSSLLNELENISPSIDYINNAIATAVSSLEGVKAKDKTYLMENGALLSYKFGNIIYNLCEESKSSETVHPEIDNLSFEKDLHRNDSEINPLSAKKQREERLENETAFGEATEMDNNISLPDEYAKSQLRGNKL